MHIWVLLSFIASLCLLLENTHLVSVSVRLWVVLLVSCPIFLPSLFLVKNPVVKKDLREGKFTHSSFPPRFSSLLPVGCPKKPPWGRSGARPRGWADELCKQQRQDRAVSVGRAGLPWRCPADTARKLGFMAGDQNLRLPQVSKHNGTQILRENKSGHCMNSLLPTFNPLWPSGDEWALGIAEEICHKFSSDLVSSHPRVNLISKSMFSHLFSIDLVSFYFLPRQWPAFLLPVGRCRNAFARPVVVHSRVAIAVVSMLRGSSSSKGLALRCKLGHKNQLKVELKVSEKSLEPKAKPERCSPSQPMTNLHCKSSLAGRRQSLWVVNVPQAFECIPASWGWGLCTKDCKKSMPCSCPCCFLLRWHSEMPL